MLSLTWLFTPNKFCCVWLVHLIPFVLRVIRTASLNSVRATDVEWVHPLAQSHPNWSQVNIAPSPPPCNYETPAFQNTAILAVRTAYCVRVFVFCYLVCCTNCIAAHIFQKEIQECGLRRYHTAPCTVQQHGRILLKLLPQQTRRYSS